MTLTNYYLVLCFLFYRYQWTNKLEGMFKDVQLSKDLQVAFKRMFEADDAATSVALDVNVCTTGFWPVVIHARHGT
jgi:cullin 3